MDRQAVCATVARAPFLRAHHLRALVTAASGDLTHSLDREILNQVNLPARVRASLIHPDLETLTADLRWIETSRVLVLASTEPEYPQQLLRLRDAPAVLFVLGDVDTLSSRQLAMVGTRKASASGYNTAREFAAHFARAGLTVTSGLALGIDAASHDGALRGGGATVAVCGTGLDIIYPTQHHELAERICARGALVSEFPPGTPPLRMNFPRRNRLISALSEGTLVVEAARCSGSLVTARRTAELQLPVFAIPGTINSPGSGGCNHLIRQGATLVMEASQVLQALKIPLLNEGVASGARGSPGRELRKKPSWYANGRRVSGSTMPLV